MRHERAWSYREGVRNCVRDGGGSLTLADSQKHLGTDRETGVSHAELDKATLNGTVYSVARSFDTDTAGEPPVFKDHYWEATLTRTGPAINLTPGAIVPSTSLLLIEQ